MREVVRYIVQAKQADGSWKTIRNTTSYQKAVMASKKADNRRLMVQTLMRDVDCWAEHWSSYTLERWQDQSDAERDAKEFSRRQR
jgi:hypothetical protein